jgi:proteic killer suppression protein
MAIQSFGDEATEDVYHGINSARARKSPPDILPAAIRKLDMVNAAHTLQDLRSPPGNMLEALKGEWKGYHSIRVNKQWRIRFRWTDAGPYEVTLLDYH